MLPTPKSPNIFNNDTRITEAARNSELLKRNSSLPTDMENGLSTQKRRDQIANESLASALMKVLKTDRQLDVRTPGSNVQLSNRKLQNGLIY